MTKRKIHPFDLFAVLEAIPDWTGLKLPYGKKYVEIKGVRYIEDRSVPVLSDRGKQLLSELEA